jgi:hypothetical protein
VILMDRWPGITYVEYSYLARNGTREIDWGFINKKIIFDSDIAEAVIVIEEKTKAERIVLHSWKVLLKKGTGNENR